MGEEERENSEEGFDGLGGGVGFGEEAVERGESGAKVGEGREGEVVVLELLGGGADDGAYVVVAGIVAEPGQD